MTTKEQFLQTVRAALHERGKPVPLPDGHEVARVIARDADLVAAFLKRIEQAKMQGVRVADEAAAVEAVASIVAACGAKAVLMPGEDIPGREGVRERLENAGVRFVSPDDPDAGFVADVGITGVTAAIAESGSLCLVSGGSHRRLASLAVPVHIAIVRAAQILPDLLDWAARQGRDLPAGQVLVSAPSKTADIELMLVMGVHGPRQEYVIVIG